jgi:hypothetical protein
MLSSTSSNVPIIFSTVCKNPAAFSSACTGRVRCVSLPSGTLSRTAFSSMGPAGGGCRAPSLVGRRRFGSEIWAGRTVRRPKADLRVVCRCGGTGGTLADLAAWRADRAAHGAAGGDPLVASLQLGRESLVFSPEAVSDGVPDPGEGAAGEPDHSPWAAHVYLACAGGRPDAGGGAGRGGTLQCDHY